MKKFVFALEPMHRLRLWHEEQAKRNLGLAQVELLKRQDEMQKLDDERGIRVSELNTSDAMEYMRVHIYIDYLDEQRNRKKQQVAQVEKIVAQRQAELGKAVVERKKVDKLRERAVEEYRLERNRDDNKKIDEVAGRMSRFA